MNKINNLTIFIISLGLLILSSCNKQKAEALQVAAENFKNETFLALDNLKFLFIQNISFVNQSIDDEIEVIIDDLQSTKNIEDINATLLEHWSSESEIGANFQVEIDTEFENLKSQYYQFEAIFKSLDKGSFLARESVKKAEKYSIKLTIQLINFLKIMQNNNFRFASQRALIIEEMKKAKSENDIELQNELLRSAAINFVELRLEEKRVKEDAIKQCLKAAEFGRIVSELIRDYSKMSVSDILISIKNSMNDVAEISGGEENITNLLEKFEKVETNIKEDPYWRVILDQEI